MASLYQARDQVAVADLPECKSSLDKITAVLD